MKHPTFYASVMLIGLLVTSTARAGDCFNDEVPASNDLEPPVPGSSADLLRITDGDIERVLRELAAYERKRRADSSTGVSAQTR